MVTFPLSKAVSDLAQQSRSLTDQDLEHPWNWGSYEEGIRYAFFRTYEELRGLAVYLERERDLSNQPITPAQRIMAQYHTAYRDLEGLLSNVSDVNAHRPPADSEWPIFKIIHHIIEAERGFFFVIQCALNRKRANQDPPLELTDEAWEAFWSNDPFEKIPEDALVAELQQYYESLHKQILENFAQLSDSELEEPSTYWEAEPLPIRFRLHRFDSHLQQHKIQIEKALTILDPQPAEARRLVRLIYQALGDAEGKMIGAWGIGAHIQEDLSSDITKRTKEIFTDISNNSI